MTVKELITELSKLPQNLEVCYDFEYSPVERIEVVEEAVYLDLNTWDDSGMGTLEELGLQERSASELAKLIEAEDLEVIYKEGCILLKTLF